MESPLSTGGRRAALILAAATGVVWLLAGVAAAGDPDSSGGSDLSITTSHSGDFTQGGQGTYTIIASNNAGTGGTTSGAVTVSDNAPSALAIQSMSGNGWDCSVVPTCTRADALAGGSSYPPITVTVTVAPDASSPQTNVASVSGGGSATATSSDPTTILPGPALSITTSHTGAFIQGEPGTDTISVSNGAEAAPSSGAVTVSDNAPPGVAIQSMSGNGWDCSVVPTCTRADALAAGSSYPPITVTVTVAPDASSPQTNVASVSGGGSATATSSDPTTILPGAALSITTSHTGAFIQGEPGTDTISVSNGAEAAPSSGAVTVSDNAPSAVAIQSMSGNGWDCSVLPTCTRADALAAGSSYPPITVTVGVAPDASSPQTNVASVSGGGSATATSSDPTTILAAQSLQFTSAAPASAVVGGAAYTVSAIGGASGNPVVFTRDSASTSGCVVSGAKVTFAAPAGTCIVDGNQTGDAFYAAAPQVQQSFLVLVAPV